jgi:hypothetical protein
MKIGAEVAFALLLERALLERLGGGEEGKSEEKRPVAPACTGSGLYRSTMEEEEEEEEDEEEAVVVERLAAKAEYILFSMV